MLPFTSAFKLYLFKDRSEVSLSVRMSDSCVMGYTLTVDEFQNLISSWDGPNGAEISTKHGHFSVYHKTRTPRPERAPTSYVRFSVYANGLAYHHRVDAADMWALAKDWYYQQHNTMHWDSDAN